MGNHLAKALRRENQTRNPPTLPVEILLEIVARADPAALIRFAASSRQLRRHITDPAFLHRYHADGGFVPSLLLGMFRQHGGGEPYRFVSMSPSTKLTLQLTPTPPTDKADELFNSYIPVTSRAGLLLLRRWRHNLIELCVCSPVTGRYSVLPAITLDYDFLHVLLPGDEGDDANTAGHSFRLLVVNQTCQTQLFSTKNGSWGPVTKTPGVLDHYERMQPAPVVLGGVAHWLLHQRQSGRYQVLAIRLGDGQAAAIGDVPESCLRRRRRRTGPYPTRFKDLLLVSTDGRQLGLLVAEVVVISLWTLSKDSKSWGARSVVVNRISMMQSVELHCDILGCVHVDLEWFGEASGAVVLRAEGAGILVLNLRTNEIVQLNERAERVEDSFRCCPYEVDPVSLIAGLKPF